MNSQRYWDNRFETDWMARGGIEQSIFFANIAIQLLPVWLKQEIKEKKYHVCDWGCAFGNGTKHLKNHLEIAAITGVDFSDAAIDRATHFFPDVKFIAADYTKDLPSEKYDVLFSSNTLEHFEHPWEILNKLAPIAQSHIVILIPFKEYDRFDEHFYTFDFNNVPCILDNGFIISHVATIDTSTLDKSYWGGKQILLVYSNAAILHQHSRSLEDVYIETAALQNDLGKQFQKELKNQFEHVINLDKQIHTYQQVIAEKDAVIIDRDATIREYVENIHQLQREILDAQSAFSTANQQHKQLTGQLQSEIAALLRRWSESQQQLNAAIQKQSDLDKNNASLAGQHQLLVNELQHEMASLLKERTDTGKQLQVTLQRQQKMEAENEALKKENHDYSIQHKAATEKNEKLTIEIKKLLNEAKYFTTILESAKGETYGSHQQYRSLSTAYEQLLNSRSWRYTYPFRMPFYMGRKILTLVKREGARSTLRKVAAKVFKKKSNLLPDTGTYRRNDTGPATPKKEQPALPEDSFPSLIKLPAIEVNNGTVHKKVCLLVQEFNEGGLERVVYDLSVQLKGKHYETCIIVAGHGGRIEKDATRAGIQVHILENDTARISPVLEIEKPDIILINHCYTGLSLFKKMGITVIEIIHNAYFWQKNQTHYKNLRSKYIDHFIAVSEFVAQYSISHLQIPEAHLCSISNGLNIAGFNRPTAFFRRRIRDLQKNTFTFLLSANFRHSKCHTTAIEAFKLVIRDFPEARLQFAGGIDDSQLHERLRKKVKDEQLEDHIEFLGLLNRKQLSQVMAAAQAGILPSSYEGLSITTLEYMFFGLPIILTDVGGARDVVSDNDIGIIIPAPIAVNKLDNDSILKESLEPESVNIQHLATAMKQMLKHRKDWENKGESGTDKICDYFIESVIERYSAIIKEKLSVQHATSNLNYSSIS